MGLQYSDIAVISFFTSGLSLMIGLTVYRRRKTTPGGLPGTETLLPLIATYGVGEGHLDWPEVVRLLSTNPARLFGLYPTKGTLLPGADADVTIYDPSVTSTLTADDLHGLAGYTPFEGFPVQGRVKTTVSRGEVIFHDGQVRESPGRGRFVAGKPFSI